MRHAIVALAFCWLLGVCLANTGWTALLLVPAGFVFGLFAAAQIALPVVLGIPNAIVRIVRGQMRMGVIAALLATPVIWIVTFFAAGFFFPRLATWVSGNAAINLSASFGMIAILLSPLSTKARADFQQDFDSSYGRFYIQDPSTER